VLTPTAAAPVAHVTHLMPIHIRRRINCNQQSATPPPWAAQGTTPDDYDLRDNDDQHSFHYRSARTCEVASSRRIHCRT